MTQITGYLFILFIYSMIVLLTVIEAKDLNKLKIKLFVMSASIIFISVIGIILDKIYS